MQKSADLKTQLSSQLKKKSEPHTNCCKKCKSFLINDSKQLTYNYLRKVLSLFKKADNQSTFYSSQQSFILF